MPRRPRLASILGKDRLAGKPGAVRAGAHASVYLGGDDNLVAAGKVPDCATEDLFAVAERITVGGVSEEVDAGFERLLMKGLLSSSLSDQA